MDSEKIEKIIYDWLEVHYPDGPEWNRPDFHSFQGCPPIIQAITAMDSIEREVSNGAWGQLLWNTFPNWRKVLDLAAQGYALIGANEYAAAIPTLSEKLAEYESQCAEAMELANKGNFAEEFGRFTSIGYSDKNFKAQFIFAGTEAYSKRREWLKANESYVLSSLEA